jgi:modification methylase
VRTTGGTGTTVVEAAHLGRRALGIDIDRDLARIARTNLLLARQQGATGAARILHGDATRATRAQSAMLTEKVDLVLAAPPLTTTTPVTASSRAQLTRLPNGRFAQRGNARLSWADGMTAALLRCRPLVRSQGLIVLVIRPWWSDGQRFDLSIAMAAAAERAGLYLADHRIAVRALTRTLGFGRYPTTIEEVPLRRPRPKSGHSTIRHSDVMVFAAQPPGK